MAEPVCTCGLNLNIWQNSWNHEPGCSMQPTGTVTAAVPDPFRDQLVLTAQIAAGRMAADWWCPNDPSRQRIDCPACIAEVAVDALLPVIAAEMERQVQAATNQRAAEGDVERAARAMHEIPAQPGVYGRIPWERLMEQHREVYRQMARAAAAALAQPAPVSKP